MKKSTVINIFGIEKTKKLTRKKLIKVSKHKGILTFEIDEKKYLLSEKELMNFLGGKDDNRF